MKIFSKLKDFLSLGFVVYGLIIVLCLLVVQTGRIDKGLKMREMLVRTPSFSSLIELETGGKIKSIELDRMIKYFEDFLVIKPDRSDFYSFLGFCYFHKGQKKRALQSYQKAVKLQPDYFWYQYNLGVALLHVGEVKAAFQVFQQALKSDFKKSIQITASRKNFFSVVIERQGFEVDDIVLRQGDALKGLQDFIQKVNSSEKTRIDLNQFKPRLF
jgi:tetratricopeptide (TPR) repeat protein